MQNFRMCLQISRSAVEDDVSALHHVSAARKIKRQCRELLDQQHGHATPALLLGYCLFGELPDTLVYVGASIVTGAGLFVIWRERSLASSVHARPKVRRSRRKEISYRREAVFLFTDYKVRYWPLADIRNCTAHVRLWPEADMGCCTTNVRFRG